jgi:hypothetical protein
LGKVSRIQAIQSVEIVAFSRARGANPGGCDTPGEPRVNSLKVQRFNVVRNMTEIRRPRRLVSIFLPCYIRRVSALPYFTHEKGAAYEHSKNPLPVRRGVQRRRADHGLRQSLRSVQIVSRSQWFSGSIVQQFQSKGEA